MIPSLLIYNYEAAVLRFIRGALQPFASHTNQDQQVVPLKLKEIQEATYSPEENLITAMSNIKFFPYFIYSRDPVNHEWARPTCFTVQHHDGTVNILRLYQFTQVYHGYIYVESAAQAFAVEMLLRDYWTTHYKVDVYAPELTCSDPGGTKPFLPVQLRLLYTKTEDKRLANNVVGSLRCVEFSWQSNLFFTNLPDNSPIGLVDTVNLGVVGSLYDSNVAPAFDADGNPIDGAYVISLSDPVSGF